jgi:hypothetical protein
VHAVLCSRSHPPSLHVNCRPFPNAAAAVNQRYGDTFDSAAICVRQPSVPCFQDPHRQDQERNVQISVRDCGADSCQYVAGHSCRLSAPSILHSELQGFECPCAMLSCTHRSGGLRRGPHAAGREPRQGGDRKDKVSGRVEQEAGWWRGGQPHALGDNTVFAYHCSDFDVS